MIKICSTLVYYNISYATYGLILEKNVVPGVNPQKTVF